MGKPRIISLYAGAGGLDYGLEAAGFETVVAIEFDADSVSTLRTNRPWPIIARNIHDVPSDEILETARLKEGEASQISDA